MHIVESSTTLTYVRSVSFGLVGDISDSNGAPVVVLPSIRSLASLGLGLARPDCWRGESGVVVGVDSSESALVFLASAVLQPRVSTVEGRGAVRACVLFRRRIIRLLAAAACTGQGRARYVHGVAINGTQHGSVAPPLRPDP